MRASLNAELLKLGKRPATWVLGLVSALITLLFWYLVRYFVLAGSPESSGPTAQFITPLLPDQLLPTVLSIIGVLGGAIGLILGALAAGTEYALGTWKTVLTQRPGRLSVLFGKALALAIIIVVTVLSTFAAGAIGSFIVARLENAAVDWPPLREMAEAVGAGVLVLTAYAALGLLLSILFRGTSLAIGFGLVYALVLEGVLSGITVRNDAFEAAQKGLFGPNASSLTSFLGTNQLLGSAPSPIEPDRAAFVLGVYAVVLVVAAALLLRHRDLA